MKAEPGKEPGLKVDRRAGEEGAFCSRSPQEEHHTRPSAAKASDPGGWSSRGQEVACR